MTPITMRAIEQELDDLTSRIAATLATTNDDSTNDLEHVHGALLVAWMAAAQFASDEEYLGPGRTNIRIKL